MKKYRFLIILLFPLIHSSSADCQLNMFSRSMDHGYVYEHVEAVEDGILILANPGRSTLTDSKIIKLNNNGVHQGVYYPVLQNSASIRRLISIWTDGDEYKGLLRAQQSDGKAKLVYVTFNKQFEIVEEIDEYFFDAPYQYVHGWNGEKKWHPMNARYEWLLRIESEELPWRRVLRVAVSSDLLEVTTCPLEAVSSFTLEWLALENGGYWVSYDRESNIFDKDFNLLFSVANTVLYNGVKYDIPNFTPIAENRDSTMFFLPWGGNVGGEPSSKLSSFWGFITLDSVLFEVKNLDELTYSTSIQALLRHDSEVDSSIFLSWSEHTLNLDPGFEGRQVVIREYNTKNQVLNTITMKEDNAVILDVEKSGDNYIGAGFFFEQDSVDNFYFIVNKDSDFVNHAIDIDVPDFSIFPNPTSSLVTLSGDIDLFIQYTIINNAGQVVTQAQLRGSHIVLPQTTGVYYLQLLTSQGLSITKKVVVSP